MMVRTPFLEELDRRVLVCDGAMGTMLYAKGIFLNRSFDELNLTQPDLVAEVHQAYVARRRRRHRDEHLRRQPRQARRVRPRRPRRTRSTCKGRKIARHAARDQAYVAGAIGPLGIRIEPWGKTGVDEAEELLPRTGARAGRGRRRSVRPRDLPRRQRDRRGDPRGPQRLRAADRRADDDRGGRQQPRRRGARVVRAGSRAARRRRRRAQLQRRPGGDARDARADGAGRDGASCPRSPTPAGRARSKGATSICARPSTWRRTRGGSSTPASAWSAAAAARRRITSGRSRWRCGRWRRPRRDRARRPDAGADAADRRRDRRRAGRSGRARREVADGEHARARRVRRQRRADAAARLPHRDADRAGAAAAHPRRRPGEHSGRPARERADERAVGRASWCSSRRGSRRSSTTPAAIGTCSACSRICSARTRWASATCCSSPAIRRRSATIPDATGGLRRRFDRPDQRRDAA